MTGVANYLNAIHAKIPTFFEYAMKNIIYYIGSRYMNIL